MRKFHQDFGVSAGPAQRLKHLRHLVDTDYVRHHRLGFNSAGGQGLDGFVEVRRIVAEYEAYIYFSHNTLERLNFVGLHADADHYYLPARTHHANRLPQSTLHTNALKYDIRIVAS